MLAIDHATPRIRDGSRRPDEEEKKESGDGDRSDYIQAVSSGQGQIADGSQVAGVWRLYKISRVMHALKPGACRLGGLGAAARALRAGGRGALDRVWERR